MVVLSIETSGCQPQTIVIGRRGTYETTQIAFDLSYLVEAYGSGVAVLAVKRSQDESAYPAVVTQEDNTLTWTVSETDTYYVGSGECQLMWYVDGGLAKTIIYPMVVMRDILQTAEEPPDGYENWIEHLTELGAETQQNAQNAAQSASEAEQAKDDAVDAKEASEEAARKAAEASVHAPIIQNGFWYIWSDDQYVNTNVRAEGEKGDKGDTGEKGDIGNGIESITKTGTSGLVDTYTVVYTDGTSTTFTVTNGAKGDKGDTGATGNGIASIEKTGTSGNVDTYTITYTNGQTTTFTVTNGAVTSVAGKTGAVVLDSGDIGYDSTETYQAGSVGAELQEQNRQLSDVEDGVVFIDYTPLVRWVEGLVIADKTIKTAERDQVSLPIFLPAGATITLKTKGDGNYFFTTIASAPYYQDFTNGATVTASLSVRTTGTAMQTFSYTASADMYVVLCALIDASTEVSFEGYPEKIALSINADPVIDFSKIGLTTFDDAGNWILSVNNAGSFIPTYPNAKYHVKAKANRVGWVSFVTALGVKGSGVAYATGSAKINLAVGEERTISAPKDAVYLYIGRKGGGNDITPDVFEIFNFSDNTLVSKKLSVDGDSICYGAGYYGGYAKLIGENNAMIVQNLGIGGGTLASGTGKHIICESMQTLDTDADYILIEGGVNDASYSVPAGSLTSGFTNTFDTATFAGAIEKICETLVTRFAGKKYGFIIPHRMSDAMYDGGSYYTVALQALKKWGVPYLDLSKVIPPFVNLGNSGVQELVDVRDAYTADTASSGHGDGWHPNKEGYLKYYVPKIEAWMMTL